VKSSEKNIMKNNTITAEWDGIWLMRSGNNIMKNNSVFNCGFVLDGPSLTDFLQDIDTSNSVNNKSVYYYKNLEGIKVPPDAGQVILVNCSNCEISNLKISNVTDCIEIMYSNNNTIRNNSLFNSTDHGIRMFKSNHNIISNNICYNNPAGISFLGITDLGGEEYDIKRANIQGDCRYNILTNNTITQNWNVGVWMFTSNNNFVSKNIFKNNRKDAFFHGCKNKWNNNYWNRPRLLPKPIFGLKTGRVIKSIPAVNFDWHPALVPYEP
jgi:parallel beta-helix repeat protein